MKLLLVCQHYYPEYFQITDICERLVQDGYDVTVLTGLPNYPEGEIFPEYKKGHRDEVINGVRVLRSFEMPRKKDVFHLAANYASFALSSWCKAGHIKMDFDLVLVYQLSPVLMALPGLRFARKHKIPLLLYCCDLWPESMKVYIKNEKNPLFFAVSKLSTYIYRKADTVIGQSLSFLPYMRRVHGIPDEKLRYIPAYAEMDYLSREFKPAFEKKTIDLTFLGNLGRAQNLIAVLQAVEKNRDIENLRVNFVGDGACMEEMQEFVRAHHLEDQVVFYGREPFSAMQFFYCMADACIVSLNAENEIGLTLPTKVQGYMAAAKPILGMIEGSAEQVIRESGCGKCVPSGDVDGFAALIRFFVEHPEEFEGCGEKGRAYFKEHFSRDAVMQKLEEEINRIGRK